VGFRPAAVEGRLIAALSIVRTFLLASVYFTRSLGLSAARWREFTRNCLYFRGVFLERESRSVYVFMYFEILGEFQ
jgi:hypothetical protein